MKNRSTILVSFIIFFFSLSSLFLLINPKVTIGAEQASDLYYKELTVQLMPHYVEPEGWDAGEAAVLVGQHGVFVNDGETPFNGEFRVQVPLHEPSFFISLVGMFDEEGQVHEVAFEIDEERGEIFWEPVQSLEAGNQYSYVIEYYFSPNVNSTNYSFSYNYELELPTSVMSVLFFEPFGAEDIQLSVEADRNTTRFGVPVHAFDLDDGDVGYSFHLDFSYKKEDSITTLEAMESQTPPDDDVHAGFRDDRMEEAVSVGNQPIVDREGAVMISLSIMIAGIFVFFGLKSRGKNIDKWRVPRKEKKVEQTRDKNVLRQQLIRGEIDEETYKKERSKQSH